MIKKMLKRSLAVLNLLVLLAGGAFAQATAKPEFEVADIRQNKSNSTDGYDKVLPGGEISARNVPMKNLLQFAYNLREEQIGSGPAWINSDRFDIDGKATPGASNDTLRLMLQKPLGEGVQAGSSPGAKAHGCLRADGRQGRSQAAESGRLGQSGLQAKSWRRPGPGSKRYAGGPGRTRLH